MSTLLIKNSQLTNQSAPADVLISDGVITASESSISEQADQTIDASGLMLIPGVIDVHVHFRVPGGEHKEDYATGSAAALAGGVTTVLDMPNTNPPITTRSALEEKLQRALQDARVHVGCYIGATNDNLKEIQASQDIACGVKVYYGTSTGGLTMNNPEVLAQIFDAGLQMPIVLHAEDDAVINANEQRYHTYTGKDIHGKIRSREAAISALQTILDLLRTHPARVHITHLSTQEELELMKNAKHEGLDITCDVTPHHLAFTTEDVLQMGHLLRVNPPIREKRDADALWEGVCNGDVDMIATDHAPHQLSEKQQEYAKVPSGLPGVQTMLLFLLHHRSDRLTLQRIVELTSLNPAERFHLEGGTLSVGAVANLTLVDCDGRTTIQPNMLYSKSNWSPFNGRTFNARIVHTIVSGDIRYSSQLTNQ